MTPTQAASLAALIQLAKEAREAASIVDLGFMMVNRSLDALRYDRAVFWRGATDRPRIAAISSLSGIDRDAPFVLWLERVVKSHGRDAAASGIHVVLPTMLDEDDRADWADFTPPEVLWCPLSYGGRRLGGLWLARSHPWTRDERAVAAHLTHAYAHALDALLRPAGRRSVLPFVLRRGWVKVLAGSMLAGTLALPVELTLLAPVTVTPHHPFTVASPLAGVIERVEVSPNQWVEAGTVLFTLDRTTLRNRRDSAQKAQEMAEAELRRAEQQAFVDPDSKGRISSLRSQVDQKRIDLALAGDLLERATIRAPQDGIAVFADANEWLGRPVAIGERVMMMAQPDDAELDIALPVADAIELDAGVRVTAFLNTAPMTPVAAALRYTSIDATPTAEGFLAYRLKATLVGGQPLPRLGARGTAKIHGASVTLFYYLFRRPLGLLRPYFWTG